MRRYRKKKKLPWKAYIRKLIFPAAFLAIPGLMFSKDIAIGKILLYGSLPYSYIHMNDDPRLKLDEDKEVWLDQDMKAVENDPDIYKKDDGIIGLDDVIYQEEEEFSPLYENGTKENITYDDLEKLRDVDYMINKLYNKDAKAGIIKEKFNVDKFLAADLSIEKNSSEPQVLIFHTHAGTEFFSDSDTSDLYEGVVGAGRELQRILKEQYGIESIHHTGVYDVIDGKSSRDGSYERMEVDVQKILKENPSIQLAIDIHRDGIEPDPKLVNYINGKPYAKFMFVNGLSAINDGGKVTEIESLKNPNLDTNLALSFNMQMAANKYFPDSTRRMYLKTYRFSTFMLPKSLLVEIGCQYNTKEEAFNSMEILAYLIEDVIFH